MSTIHFIDYGERDFLRYRKYQNAIKVMYEILEQCWEKADWNIHLYVSPKAFTHSVYDYRFRMLFKAAMRTRTNDKELEIIYYVDMYKRRVVISSIMLNTK